MFTKKTIVDNNLDRVIYWVKNKNETIYIGTVIHTGILQWGLYIKAFIQARDL